MVKKNEIVLWIVDVDGTLTDGGIYYDENGNELKKFCTKDAAGFFALHELGIQTMVLTGRECAATKRRMEELKVDYFYQNIKNKREFMETFITEKKIGFQQIAYVGDDLNDLPVMSLCGYKACPLDSCVEIRQIADYVSGLKGGYGAVRDCVEYWLRERKLWEQATKKVYGIGF